MSSLKRHFVCTYQKWFGLYFVTENICRMAGMADNSRASLRCRANCCCFRLVGQLRAQKMNSPRWLISFAIRIVNLLKWNQCEERSVCYIFYISICFHSNQFAAAAAPLPCRCWCIALVVDANSVVFPYFDSNYTFKPVDLLSLPLLRRRILYSFSLLSFIEYNSKCDLLLFRTTESEQCTVCSSVPDYRVARCLRACVCLCLTQSNYLCVSVDRSNVCQSSCGVRWMCRCRCRWQCGERVLACNSIPSAQIQSQ